MSDKIKPSEVSEILIKELQGINSEEKFDEVGNVLTVGDGVARVYGLETLKPTSCLNLRMAPWLSSELGRRQCWLCPSWSF